MKRTVEKRKPSGFADYVALALTTFGVGYIPGAPGTYGSAVAVGIYLFINSIWLRAFPSSDFAPPPIPLAQTSAILAVGLLGFSLVGIWASNRSIPLLGNDDPSEAVVDEVLGQLVTFCFIPVGLTWPFVLAGFLLFRLFDIWKPYPIDGLQVLPGGLGVCADDLVAGIYAGVCLAIGYAIYLSV